MSKERKGNERERERERKRKRKKKGERERRGGGKGERRNCWGNFQFLRFHDCVFDFNRNLKGGEVRGKRQLSQNFLFQDYKPQLNASSLSFLLLSLRVEAQSIAPLTRRHHLL